MKENKIITFAKNHLVNYPTPIDINYNWSFGALSGIFYGVQIITGVLLAIHYTASIDIVFENIEHIMRNVNNGWLIRYLHANSASFFFICIYLHIFRGIFYKSYNKPRNAIWNSGVIILILSIVVAFIGYVLPWGQMSYWGATVITNLVTAIPLIGNSVVIWIWGGFTVSGSTILRFYDFHYLSAILLGILIFLHLTFLHEIGSSSPIVPVNFSEKIKFYRYFYLKDTFVLIIFLIIFLIIIFYYPNVLGHTDNYIKANSLVTPTHIVPEWYSLPFYAILRPIDNKLFGVIAMLLSILILMVLPFISFYIKNIDFIGGFDNKIFFILFCLIVILLWFIGFLPAEYPYIYYGKALTFLYFNLFLFNYFYSLLCNKFVKIL